MLLSIEAIAWFLLRQYRSLVEDYKTFHRLYIKRANYLLAHKILSHRPATSEDLTIAGSLLTEDLSGRLAQGQSTEALEAMKTIEPNPVTTLIEAAIKRLGPPKE